MSRLGRAQRTYTSERPWRTLPEMAHRPYVCGHCHHVVGENPHDLLCGNLCGRVCTFCADGVCPRYISAAVEDETVYPPPRAVVQPEGSAALNRETWVRTPPALPSGSVA